MVTAENLNVVRNCFMDGDVSDNPKLFNNWRLFNFSIIQVELLSEVYELFLGQQRLEKGQFYTPHGLVDLILEEKLPIIMSEYLILHVALAFFWWKVIADSFRDGNASIILRKYLSQS